MPNIRPISDLRNSANEISDFCKQTREPVFITKNGEGDLVVQSIEAYNRREASLELREKLLEAEEQLSSGAQPIALADAAEHWRALSHAIHDR